VQDRKKNVENVLRINRRAMLNPSPIAMNNTFHQTREEVARRIDDARKTQPDTPTLRKLLANPEFTTWASLAPALLQPLVVAQLMEVTEERAEPLVRTLGAVYESPTTAVGPGHAHERLVCGYFDLGRFESPRDLDPERGFPAISARLYDVGPSARVHDGVDIGGGFGWVTFTGEGVNFSKFTFTPLRVVLRPLVIAVPDDLRKRWMGVFSFYWKETYVRGPLTAADFGLPGSTWSENGELIRSFGMNVDLTALIPWNIPLRR
jgi:hypothetical protein